MSQRSIIEINHDIAGRVTETPAGQFELLLAQAIASGSDRAWAPLAHYGIRRIVQLHHSDDRKVVTKYAEYPIS